MDHKFDSNQSMYVKAMYDGASRYLADADPEAVKDWQQAASCIYGHMVEKDEGPVMRMMQVAITSQVLECLLGHLSYGGDIMRQIDGPMAALIVQAYSELQLADIEVEILWPQTIPG
jgi:hypothetical protein